jgi:hypothetical protein
VEPEELVKLILLQMVQLQFTTLAAAVVEHKQVTKEIPVVKVAELEVQVKEVVRVEYQLQQQPIEAAVVEAVTVPILLEVEAVVPAVKVL